MTHKSSHIIIDLARKIAETEKLLEEMKELLKKLEAD